MSKMKSWTAKTNDTIRLNEIREDCLFNDTVEACLLYPLVQATLDFIHQTDPNYQEKRDTNISEETILGWINNMARAIEQFEKNIENNKLQKNIIFDTILGDCKQQINSRLSDLKGSEDRIYDIFSQQENNLKTIIQIPSYNTGPSY